MSGFGITRQVVWAAAVTTLGLTAAVDAAPLGVVAAGASTQALVASHSLSAQAKAALLVRSDLPKGWTATKGSGNSNFLPPSPDFAQCTGVSLTLLGENPPQVNSPSFSSKDQSYEVDDIVSEFSSKADARSQFESMANPKTPGCLNQLATTNPSLFYGSPPPKGTTVGTITITPGPSIPGTASFIQHTPITSGGASLTVTETEIVFVRGQLGQQLQFYGYGPNFPSSLEKHLVSVAMHRL